jgi:hypothetical protein
MARQRLGGVFPWASLFFQLVPRLFGCKTTLVT